MYLYDAQFVVSFCFVENNMIFYVWDILDDKHF